MMMISDIICVEIWRMGVGCRYEGENITKNSVPAGQEIVTVFPVGGGWEDNPTLADTVHHLGGLPEKTQDTHLPSSFI